MTEWKETPQVKRSFEEALFLRERLEKYAGSIMNHPDKADQNMILDYFHTLYALVEKEELIYTRMTLSEDAECKEMVKTLTEQLRMFEVFDENANMRDVFAAVKKEIRSTLTKLDDNTPLDEDPFL